MGGLRSKKQRDEDPGQCTASFYGKTFIGSGIRRFRLNCRVTNVSAGAQDVAIVCAGGTLMVWGSNEYGQCALGHKNPVTSLTVVKGIQNVVQVAMGDSHLLIRKRNGFTMECGDYRSDRSGMDMDTEEYWKDETGHPRLKPTRSIGNKVAVQVAAGGAMAMVLLKNGKVFTWATNSCPASFILSHDPVMHGATYSSMGPGGAYSFSLIRNPGCVRVTGRDFFCRLGLGTQHGYTKYGFEWVSTDKPARIKELNGSDITGFAMREFQVIAFGDPNGTASAWGMNDKGMLGQPKRIAVLPHPTLIDTSDFPPCDRIHQAAMGKQHSILLGESGHVKWFGSNKFGQAPTIAEGPSSGPGRVPRRHLNRASHVAALEHASLVFTNDRNCEWLWKRRRLIFIAAKTTDSLFSPLTKAVVLLIVFLM